MDTKPCSGFAQALHHQPLRTASARVSGVVGAQRTAAHSLNTTAHKVTRHLCVWALVCNTCVALYKPQTTSRRNPWHPADHLSAVLLASHRRPHTPSSRASLGPMCPAWHAGTREQKSVPRLPLPRTSIALASLPLEMQRASPFTRPQTGTTDIGNRHEPLERGSPSLGPACRGTLRACPRHRPLRHAAQGLTVERPVCNDSGGMWRACGGHVATVGELGDSGEAGACAPRFLCGVAQWCHALTACSSTRTQRPTSC